MSIQQATNNVLFSAQVGAGLYAHSPAGKAKIEDARLASEIKKTKTTEEFALDKIKELGMEQFDPSIQKAKQIVQEQFATTVEKLEGARFRNLPSKEAEQRLAQAVERKQALKALKEENRLRFKGKYVYLDEKPVKGTYKLGGKE